MRGKSAVFEPDDLPYVGELRQKLANVYDDLSDFEDCGRQKCTPADVNDVVVNEWRTVGSGRRSEGKSKQKLQLLLGSVQRALVVSSVQPKSAIAYLIQDLPKLQVA